METPGGRSDSRTGDEQQPVMGAAGGQPGSGGSEHRRDGRLSESDFLPAVGGGYAVACCTRGVAQFGSVFRSGRRGRGFKSRHLDDEKTHELAHEVFEEEGVRGHQAEYPDQGGNP